MWNAYNKKGIIKFDLMVVENYVISGCPRHSLGQRSVHVYVCEAVKQHLKLIQMNYPGKAAIKQHMMKCIKLEKCIELLEGNKKQNKIIGEEWDNSSVNEKVALDFYRIVCR